MIKELKSGSEAAFRELVETYKNKVVNTCFGFVHNYEDADDIAQEVFIEVFKSIKYFKEDSSLSTWIYRIATNKSLDYLRKVKRQKRWSELTRLSLSSNESISNLLTDSKTPFDIMEDKERFAALNTAIDKLANNQKAAFTLHKYEELSYKEIADILDTSLSSVESLIHRAKKNLQKYLFNYYKNQ
ncbi:MAG: RNA polymerase sigma factor [Salinivirgaceae bacterium]|nr:RNA polymerase sigma factor [Salinivirgaceae bacterium]